MFKDSFHCKIIFFDVIKPLIISAIIIWLIEPGGIVLKLVGTRPQIWNKFIKIWIFLETILNIIWQSLFRWIPTVPYMFPPDLIKRSSVMKCLKKSCAKKFGRLTIYGNFTQNLHWKLGQQTPSAGTLLAYLETTA